MITNELPFPQFIISYFTMTSYFNYTTVYIYCIYLLTAKTSNHTFAYNHAPERLIYAD